MAGKKPSTPEAETPFAFLLSCAEPETIERLRSTLAEDQEKLFLILLRSLNPVEHLDNPEEGRLRNLNRNTIGKLKAEGAIPQEPGAPAVVVRQ